MKGSMSAINVAIVSLTLLILAGCESETIDGSDVEQIEQRNVVDFKKITVNGPLTVIIEAAAEFGVTVEGDSNLISFVQTETDEDVLHISMSNKDIAPSIPLTVTITMPDLIALDATSSSVVRVDHLKNNLIDIESSGAALIFLSGSTNLLQINSTDTSKIDAQDLMAKEARVDASMSTTVVIFVTKVLHAAASGGSKIVYLGEPKLIEKETSGTSSIMTEN